MPGLPEVPSQVPIAPLLDPVVTGLPEVPSQSTSASDALATGVASIRHKYSTPSTISNDHIARSVLPSQTAGIDLPSSREEHSQSSSVLDLNHSLPMSLNLNSTQKGLKVGDGEFATSTNIEIEPHSHFSVKHPSSVRSLSFDHDDATVSPSDKVFSSRTGYSLELPDNLNQ